MKATLVGLAVLLMAAPVAAQRDTLRATTSSPRSTGRHAPSAAPWQSPMLFGLSGSRCAQGCAALAPPSEVLVSQTVRDLMVGSDLTFAERGSHELKSVPGMWGLYAARKEREPGGSDSITAPA